MLGVDPGSLKTGWALVGGAADRPIVIECGTIALDPHAAFAERLHGLQAAFTPLVGRLRPTAAAVESPFHGASARSALQLAHARGVVLAVLAGQGVPVADYAPATVKKCVTGHGRADKAQVQFMVRRLAGQDVVLDGADVADAVAIGICHLAHAAFEKVVTPTSRPGGSRRGATTAARAAGRTGSSRADR